MKPIKLTMQAFGPYANKEIVDFRDLGDRTFFLIHGPTGSGKSTILDGICFALYGDTSGEERDAKEMRSGNARDDVLTELIFDFSLGENQYRIYRSPEQERPKLKGGGYTTEPTKAILWNRTGLSDDNKLGDVIASHPTEVTIKIEELLGLRSDEFRQVVMLPQDKFRQFLLADSKDREKILETLFRTEWYRLIQEALKEAAKDIRDERDEIIKSRDGRFEDAEVESINELEKKREEVNRQANQLQEKLKQDRKVVEEAQKRVNKGKQDLEKIKEKNEAQKAFDGLENRKEEFKVKQSVLDQARKALPLVEVESELIARCAESKEASDVVKKADEALKKAREANGMAQKNLKGEVERKDEREKLGKEIDRLDFLTNKVKKLVKAKEDFYSAGLKVNDIDRQREKTKRSLDSCQGNLKISDKKLRETERLAAQLEGKESAYKDAEKKYQQRKELDDLKKELREEESIHRQKKKTLDSAEVNLKKSRGELDTLQDRWNKGQAGVLSKTLKKDKPCPVCGSIKHPAPAHFDETLPTEAELEEKRKNLDELEAKIKELRKEEKKADRNVTKLTEKVDAIEKDLREWKDEKISTLKANKKNTEEDWQQAKEAKGRLKTLNDELGKLQEKETELKKLIEAIDKGLAAAKEDLSSKQTVIKETEAEVPEEIRELDTIEKARANTEKKLNLLNKALEDAREKANQVGNYLSGCEASFTKAQESFRNAKAKEKAILDKFESQLKNVGFRDAQDFKLAKLPQEGVYALEKTIKEYEGQLNSAKDRLSRAIQASQDLKAPDIDSLVKESELARTTLEGALQDEITLKNQIDRIDKLLDELKRIDEKIKNLESKYEILGSISEVANGKNAMGITFQRFVQATLLDDVLIAASSRLSIMSKGRFVLRRALERTDRRIQSGLDLVVDDSHTGKTRPVSTLSGGESFLASLSLALGLADVVQSYAGGVRLDTIFIDEGFGSLDSESLELAVRTLVDLQQGGRLVGIISHVSDLQEWIDARLEVSSSSKVSTTRFVVG